MDSHYLKTGKLLSSLALLDEKSSQAGSRTALATLLAYQMYSSTQVMPPRFGLGWSRPCKILFQLCHWLGMNAITISNLPWPAVSIQLAHSESGYVMIDPMGPNTGSSRTAAPPLQAGAIC